MVLKEKVPSLVVCCQRWEELKKQRISLTCKGEGMDGLIDP
jgi:hypothetical protein